MMTIASLLKLTKDRFSRPQVRPHSASLLTCPCVGLGLRSSSIYVKSWTSGQEEVVCDVTGLKVGYYSMYYPNTWHIQHHLTTSPNILTLTAIGRFRLLLRRYGTRCLTSSEIRRVVLTVLSSFLRQSSLVFTNVTSALEFFLNVMRYINPHSTYLLTYLLYLFTRHSTRDGRYWRYFDISRYQNFTILVSRMPRYFLVSRYPKYRDTLSILLSILHMWQNL